MTKCPDCKECMDMTFLMGVRMYYCLLCGTWWHRTLEGLTKGRPETK